MSIVSPAEKISASRRLIDNFAERTGLKGANGDPDRRYLWTDAFAVQTCFGMARALDEPAYHQLALKLINGVHATLGRHHPADERTGWISGLPEEEARAHPTAGGLRIGKPATERPAGVPLDQRREWDRDGQYFHYLTRWCTALLRAAAETGEERYGRWAAELMLAGGSFIDRRGGQLTMYWKMSTDLSRPLVPSTGAHDPLEGLLCSLSARRAAPDLADELDPLIADFVSICSGRHWATADPLGIGGLLLATLRSFDLAQTEGELPNAIHPFRLLGDGLSSLEQFGAGHSSDAPANHRLAFRECGLSLGLRALHSAAPRATIQDQLAPFLPLADRLEAFWLESRHRSVPSWRDHEDINAVTLAASLVADSEGAVFG